MCDLVSHVGFIFARRLRAQLGLFNVPENLVISCGGVATTEFMNYASRHAPMNHPGDRDGMKHWVGGIPYAKRVVFVTGDAGKQTASLARRGILTVQYIKLGGGFLAIFSNGFSLRKAAEDRIRKLNRGTATKYPDANILFVNYSELFESAQTIGEFLEVVDLEAFVANFPKRRSQQSEP